MRHGEQPDVGLSGGLAGRRLRFRPEARWMEGRQRNILTNGVLRLLPPDAKLNRPYCEC